MAEQRDGREQWLNSRRVVERVFVRGRLQLETPAHFGNGDSEALTDIPLLRDSLNNRTPLVTGASIAGALRAYLREYEAGYQAPEERTGSLLAERLFGHLRDDQSATYQSWLMVDDALGSLPVQGAIELRDGVAIEGETRTAEENKKFDIELLGAGTTFGLSFELWLTDENRDLLPALAVALHGLEAGRIGLGMRKRRGLGEARVTDWRVWRYRMDNVQDVVGWLTHDPEQGGEFGEHILDLLGVKLTAVNHRGRDFRLSATFHLDGSLLIRSESGGRDAPDMVHLRSWRGENGRRAEQPTLSGTSLAGVIRSRASRIARTLKGEAAGADLVNGMFGKRSRERLENPTGSRVVVRETVVQDGRADLVQSRVKIDRFTSGSYPQALFSQQPLWGQTRQPTQVNIVLELRQPYDAAPGSARERRFHAEVGLLLLVLKDLWTGDVALGGESSVGRGRLAGQSATLTLGGTTWSLTRTGDGKLTFGGNGKSVDLEQVYLKALRDWETRP